MVSSSRSFRPDDRRRQRVDSDQVLELISQLRGQLDDLEFGVAQDRPVTRRGTLTASELVRRSRQPSSNDGYPTSSIAAGTSGGSYMTIDDENGQPDTVEVTGVERTVLSRLDNPQGDPVRRAAGTVLRGLTGALGDLRMATSALHNAEPPVVADTDEDRCRLHWTLVQKWQPIHRDGLCRFCYDTPRLYDVDVTRPLLEAHDTGKKITSKQYRELGAPTTHRRRPGGPR
jgi:hypothetical protein